MLTRYPYARLATLALNTLVFVVSLFVVQVLALGPQSSGALAQPVNTPTQIEPAQRGLAPEAVIEAQLAAMATANWQQAFDYAAPAVQGKLGSSQAFATMVETGFAYMIAPAHTQLTRLGQHKSDVLIEAIFIARSRSVHRVLYHLVQDAETGWRIAGVFVGRTDELAT